MNCSLLTALLITLFSYSVSAQSDTTSQERSWFFSLHSGALLGKPGNGTSVSVTVMPGIRLDRLAMAVGAGYDTYAAWKTIPLFAGLGYDVFRRRNYTLFVHFNAGYSRAWNSLPAEMSSDYKNEGGYFYHPFIGCRLREGNIYLYFSAGYKFQNITYEHAPRWGWGSGVRTSVKADMQRFSVQFGIGI